MNRKGGTVSSRGIVIAWVALCVVWYMLGIATGRATAAEAWESDTFQSPTGNLICKYRWNLEAVTCGAFSSSKIIHLRKYGRPVEGRRISWDGSEDWPTLRYGEAYNRGRPVSCRSLWAGIRCQNADGWFFVIDRSRVYVGRFGQRLYWL